MPERTIVVADDNTELRNIFVRRLREFHDVRGVETGDALLDALDPSVDVVVCDWRIEGTQQLELLTAIERSPCAPSIIAISGCLPTRNLQAHGVAECLEKPFKLDTLRAAIQSALEEQPDASPPQAQSSMQ
jgi:DNA-binding NtrC family response regulator